MNKLQDSITSLFNKNESYYLNLPLFVSDSKIGYFITSQMIIVVYFGDRQMDLSEFEAITVYIVSSRILMAI